LGALVATNASSDPGFPPYTIALAKQLGLKLQSGGGPVDVLVIDSVQPPGEN
jgi:uncharacterized protein (TIGR03435 family)